MCNKNAVKSITVVALCFFLSETAAEKLIRCSNGHCVCVLCRRRQHRDQSPAEPSSISCTGSVCTFVRAGSTTCPLCTVVDKSAVTTTVSPAQREEHLDPGGGTSMTDTSRKRKIDHINSPSLSEPPVKRAHCSISTDDTTITDTLLSGTELGQSDTINRGSAVVSETSAVASDSNNRQLSSNDNERLCSGFGSAIAGESYAGVYCKISIDSNISVGFQDEDEDDEEEDDDDDDDDGEEEEEEEEDEDEDEEDDDDDDDEDY